MPRPFLTASWQDLAIITYAVPRALLEPRVPRGLELDDRNGQVFASLVAFDFRDCCVRGVRWPGCVNFPEINLRFYVREKAGQKRRGVVFVREFVPSRLTAWVARTIYNEPYSVAKMFSRVIRERRRVRVEHEFQPVGLPRMRIAVQGLQEPFIPPPESDEHFFKEHSWGYGTTRSGQTLIYNVEHPCWEVFRDAKAEVQADFRALYGPGWEALMGAAPVNVVLAVGSGIKVIGHAPLPEAP